MRIMYDGVTPSAVPAGAQLYAGYLNGAWQSYGPLAAAHTAAAHVSISVTAGANVGQVLDVENGDATPAESVNWVLTRRHAGADPTVYCSMSAWPAVKAAFQTHDVPQPHYWIADYSLGDSPALPAGAIALQYADRGGYDESVVADYWPGVDPAPTTQGDDMTFTQVQENQLLNDTTNTYAAVFTGGTSTGATPPGATNNSIVAKLDYLVSQAAAQNAALTVVEGELKTGEPITVDATALAAALAANAAFVNGVAAAVVAKIGADITAAPKAP